MKGTESKHYILEHVLYEFQMYQHTLALIINRVEEANFNDIIFKALFESHMLHVRNLFKFFNNPPVKKGKDEEDDNLVYSRILGEVKNEYSSHNEYKKHRGVINKCINHLTDARTNEDLIKRNNANLFLYLFYSSIQSIEFVGFGQLIHDFLNEIVKNNQSIRQEILQELKDPYIQKVIETISHDNIMLMGIKNHYTINIDDKYIITIKTKGNIKIALKDIEV